jgi:hypothetical protein
MDAAECTVRRDEGLSGTPSPTALDAGSFTVRLDDLSVEDFHLLASDLRADVASADGEVGWWRATMAVGTVLRRTRRTREAGMAAHAAASAVVARAERLSLLEHEHDDVTVVARAAAEVARGLVAGRDVADHVARLLGPWRATLGPALSAA